MSKPQIIIAGHLCLDLIPSFSSGSLQLDPGKLTSIGAMTFATGGCVSNVGLALIKLGVSTALMGKVGRDVFGHAVKDIIKRYDANAAEAIKINAEEVTSYTIVLNPPGIDRHFLHFPGSNDTFSAKDIDLDIVGQSKIFYFGYPPLMRRMWEDGGLECANLYKQVKALGVTTALDMTLPDPNAPAGQIDWKTHLKRVLRFTDIFIPSLPELLYMLERPLFDMGAYEAQMPAPMLSDLSEKLLEMGVAIAGIKLGSQGLYLRTSSKQRLEQMGHGKPANLETWANCELWSPVFDVTVRGTVGAGDTTYAGFLTALLKGLGPAEALTMACAVGACSVEAPDAVSGIQSWEDTLARVKRGWARGSSHPDATWQAIGNI